MDEWNPKESSDMDWFFRMFQGKLLQETNGKSLPSGVGISSQCEKIPFREYDAMIYHHVSGMAI